MSIIYFYFSGYLNSVCYNFSLVILDFYQYLFSVVNCRFESFLFLFSYDLQNFSFIIWPYIPTYFLFNSFCTLYFFYCPCLVLEHFLYILVCIFQLFFLCWLSLRRYNLCCFCKIFCLFFSYYIDMIFCVVIGLLEKKSLSFLLIVFFSD